MNSIEQMIQFRAFSRQIKVRESSKCWLNKSSSQKKAKNYTVTNMTNELAKKMLRDLSHEKEKNKKAIQKYSSSFLAVPRYKEKELELTKEPPLIFTPVYSLFKSYHPNSNSRPELSKTKGMRLKSSSQTKTRFHYRHKKYHTNINVKLSENFVKTPSCK